jgi:glycosyltransferase involved in cell wall biosynthesis
MIYFWTPDDNTPRGGIKQIYRNVGVLNSASINACVLHTKRNFRCTWFDHDVPIAYIKNSKCSNINIITKKKYFGKDIFLLNSIKHGYKFKLSHDISNDCTVKKDDIFVLPEFLGFELTKLNLKNPIVIFNQNVHTTFRGCGVSNVNDNTIYNRKNMLGVIVVSEHNLNYLKYAFPYLHIQRVINGVDQNIFNPFGAKKKFQIAYMPRKLYGHIEQVINILSARKALNGWCLAPIENMSETDVARVLRESLIYISTCKEEGFGLPPVEAGMSGCFVIGYTGGAADEYFKKGLCERIEQDDVISLAKIIENTLRIAERNICEISQKGLEFSEYLTKQYNLERESKSVLWTWKNFLI